MHKVMLSYIQRDSVVHSLTGAAKLMCFLLWSFAAMLTFDTRLLAFMLVLGVTIFGMAKIRLSEIWVVLLLVMLFILLNDIAIFVFSPYEGVNIYGSRYELFQLGGVFVTREQLFYMFNVTLKYFTVLPIALLFLLTTDPSEFASSLNSIGLNYKIAYAVSLALRYIPDIQKKYSDVAIAQQARGIDISKKEKLTRRIKNGLSIVVPLIFSSLQRIETISNAMELRRFGKNNKRSWYSARSFRRRDIAAVIVAALLLCMSLMLTALNGNRFYNPF